MGSAPANEMWENFCSGRGGGDFRKDFPSLRKALTEKTSVLVAPCFLPSNAVVRGCDAWSGHASQLVIMREGPGESNRLTWSLSSFL